MLFEKDLRGLEFGLGIGRAVSFSCHLELFRAGTVLRRTQRSYPGMLGKNTMALLVKNGSL